jgi:hypothetical protein
MAILGSRVLAPVRTGNLFVRIADSSVGNADLVMPLLQHVASNVRAVFHDVLSGPALPF